MNTAEIPTFLVEPAAGMVYRTGGVFFCHHFRDTGGIELPPALVERHPHSNGRHIVQMIYGVKTFLFPAFPAFFRTTGEQFIMIVLRVSGHVGKQGGHIAYPGHMIGGAAADHILPYDHAQTITMVIPAQGLNLDMLPEHVESQSLCEANIIDEGFVAGSGHQSVGPVALIQNSVEEIGSVIQTKTQDPLGIFFHCEHTHGKIAFHGIVIGRQGKRIQPGMFRTPGLEVRGIRHSGRSGGGVGDTGGKRKGYGCMGETEGVLLFGQFSHAQPDRGIVLRERTIAGGSIHPEIQLVKRFGRTQNEGYGSLVILRSDLIVDHIIFRDPFVPDALPDTTLGGVKHAAAGQSLLAPGGITGVGQIPDFYIERNGVCSDIFRNVQRKGKVAATVGAERLRTEKDGCLLIDCIKMQNAVHMVIFSGNFFRRKRKFAMIPQILLRFQPSVYSGKQGFR